MLNKLLNVRKLTPFLHNVPSKITQDNRQKVEGPLESSSASTLKLVHAGGKVEVYFMAIPAANIMEKYPSFVLARPDIFKRPWESVVCPDEILRPGEKFYVVPLRTVRKLRKRNKRPNLLDVSAVNSFQVSQSSSIDISAEMKNEKSKSVDSHISGDLGKGGGIFRSNRSVTMRIKHVTFSGIEDATDKQQERKKNTEVNNSNSDQTSSYERKKETQHNSTSWQPKLAVISEKYE